MENRLPGMLARLLPLIEARIKILYIVRVISCARAAGVRETWNGGRSN
jgi:hypothetical protein